MTSSTLRIALIAALWTHAAGYILYTLASIGLPFPFEIPLTRTSPGAYFSLVFFETASFVPVLLLWLAFLVRIGIAIGSRPFLTFAILTLAARLLTALAWTTLYIYYLLLILHGPLPSVPVTWQEIVTTTSRYADILSAPPLVALSIWCIFLMPPLAKKSAPLAP